MLFGVCRGERDFESLKFFKDAGYDYVISVLLPV